MSFHPFVEESARRRIDEIRSVVGVAACALVSCEGIIMGKYFPEGGLSSSLFATMCATVIASAEAACGSANIERPSMVTITAADATILILSAGQAALITAVIDKSVDLPGVQRQLLDIAVRIREEA